MTEDERKLCAQSFTSEPNSELPCKMVPVTEDEIRNVLMEEKQLTTYDLVFRFAKRLTTKEDKVAFAGILRKIAKIQKNEGSQNFVVLKDSNETLLSSELGRLFIS